MAALIVQFCSWFVFGDRFGLFRALACQKAKTEWVKVNTKRFILSVFLQ